jgi:hypothetical protein
MVDRFVSFLEEFDKKNNTIITTGDKIWETGVETKPLPGQMDVINCGVSDRYVFGYSFSINILTHVLGDYNPNKFRLIKQLELLSKSEKMQNKFCCRNQQENGFNAVLVKYFNACTNYSCQSMRIRINKIN